MTSALYRWVAQIWSCLELGVIVTNTVKFVVSALINHETSSGLVVESSIDSTTQVHASLDFQMPSEIESPGTGIEMFRAVKGLIVSIRWPSHMDSASAAVRILFRPMFRDVDI